MNNCIHKGCKNRITQRVIFEIFLLGIVGAPAIAAPPYCACDKHATQEKADDMLKNNPVGRRMLEEQFKITYGRAIDWKRSKAEFHPLTRDIFKEHDQKVAAMRKNRQDRLDAAEKIRQDQAAAAAAENRKNHGPN